MKKITFTENQLKDFSKKVNNGTSLRKLEEETGFNRKILSREIKKYLSKRTNFSNRKYELNENYFEKIDSPEKAYWLGFIAADGCVYQTGSGSSVLSFNLNVKDKNHLEKFLQAIESTANIKTIKGCGFGTGTDIASLQINSNKIVKDLNNLGIIQKKSLILNKPNIDEKFYNDWIRGYFDGDGSITVELPNGNSQINFLGTKEVLTFIQEVLRPEKINKLQSNGLNKNSFSLTYGGKQLILQLLNKFYKNPIIYLDRKYEKVLKVYSRFEEQSSKLSEGELLETP